ncbi:hypothetical protein Tco_0168809 [Tanacetum coccineum]
MRVDELYKFSDETLKSVRKILHERLMNFKPRYNKDIPNRKCTDKDQNQTDIMVKLIDKQLLERSIMRSLEGLNIRVVLHSIYSDDRNPSSANIKQAPRLVQSQNPVNEILLNTTLSHVQYLYCSTGNWSVQDEAYHGRLFKSFQYEVKYEHVGPKVTRLQEGKGSQRSSSDEVQDHKSTKHEGTSSNITT